MEQLTSKTQPTSLKIHYLFQNFQAKCECFHGLGNETNFGTINVYENWLQYDESLVTPMPSCARSCIDPIIPLLTLILVQMPTPVQTIAPVWMPSTNMNPIGPKTF